MRILLALEDNRILLEGNRLGGEANSPDAMIVRIIPGSHIY